MGPLTADEREKRIVQYLRSLNKGELGEYQLSRFNRVANFRKELMQLLEKFIEARAEILCAAMLMDDAAPRTESQLKAIAKARPRRRIGRRMPPWLKKEGQAAGSN